VPSSINGALFLSRWVGDPVKIQSWILFCGDLRLVLEAVFLMEVEGDLVVDTG
jgi:hypothetical protein